MRGLATTSRLTALDNTFLRLEDGSSGHMHVAGVLLFRGAPPAYDDLVAAVERRLHLVPRYRQKLHQPPLRLHTPEWVDDPHFNIGYHVRQTALPRPGGDDQLRRLAGRVFSQRLDRGRPLWELWLVEGLFGDRFALLSKTHHALVDGVSGVDIATVLFDLEPEPPDAGAAPRTWIAEPEPSAARSVVSAVRDRVGAPAGAARAALDRVRQRPAELAEQALQAGGGLASLVGSMLRSAPRSIYNVPIGPHRRFTWVDASLDDVKAVKNSLGGTVNDVVLAAVTGMLRRHMRRRGEDVEGVELVAMVPVSVRLEAEHGALGNRVSTMFALLPVGARTPQERLRVVSDRMRSLKESGQAVGAEALVRVAGLASATVFDQAARVAASARTFNLTVTNVPGPQIPIYLLGRELQLVVPMVPIPDDHALGIAIMSYNGRLCFGLVGDYDASSDIEDVAGALRAELAALGTAARRESAPRDGHRPGARRRSGARAGSPSGTAPTRSAATGRRPSPGSASATPGAPARARGRVGARR